ncbi:MAG: hypothetical protein KKA73_04875 [Chloroflexi bacterium]|nr:hypothetical protein [Chloroflexota bacterium]MBU1747000.1 hypothetical protein [Chloroflexota bacterium]MBU1878539.1 hypothetical protein [Chloroflexota bacterium]
MSFDSSAIKRLVLAGVAIGALTLAGNAGYGLVAFQLRGTPPLAALREMQTGAPYLVLGLFLAAVGAILGVRLAAGTGHRWAGVVIGAGLALMVVAVGWLQGRLDFWLLPNAVMAVFGGWLGGSLVAARRQT